MISIYQLRNMNNLEQVENLKLLSITDLEHLYFEIADYKKKYGDLYLNLLNKMNVRKNQQIEKC